MTNGGQDSSSVRGFLGNVSWFSLWEVSEKVDVCVNTLFGEISVGNNAGLLGENNYLC